MSIPAKILFPAFLAASLWGLLSPAAAAAVKIPYPATPQWTSADTDYGTGCGFGDINNDGWPDLVVANGNDMNRERVIVYYNKGDGTFPTSPDWTSGDIDYNGHLAIGDVNGDGWLDVAVAVFLGPGGFSTPGHAKLYLNDGAGTLESTPSWRSQDDFYTFSITLGDADGDGDLDLAAATGEPYSHITDKNRIFFNNGGVLDPLPGWYSNESDSSMDVAFGDMDGDGALDLVVCNADSPLRIYYGTGAGIQTAAGWSAASPSSPNGNTVSLGDIDGDGFLDVVFSDNYQIGGGTGRFMAYMSDGSGGHGTTPAWQSEVVGYVSGVVVCDADGDGDKDVIGGSWWGDVRVYANEGGTLSTAAGFTTQTDSVVEALPLGDADLAGLETVAKEIKAGDGQKKVFYCDETPVLSVERIYVDGVQVPESGYCFDSESGWISLAAAPVSYVALWYTTTTSTDFAVSNWDDNKGNYLFYRRDMTVSLTPPANPNIKQGTVLPVTAAFVNYTSAAPPVTIAAEARLPGGGLYPMDSFNTILPGHLFFTGHKDYPIPLYAPLGGYEFIATLSEAGQEIDRDSFPFNVVP